MWDDHSTFYSSLGTFVKFAFVCVQAKLLSIPREKLLLAFLWRINCSLLLARVKKVDPGKRFFFSVVVRSLKHKIVGLLDQFKF